MKKATCNFPLLLTTLLFVTQIASAQNLVSNGSFETYTSCPTSAAQINLAPSWTVPSNHFGSPDYYNPCSSSLLASAPTNVMGTQNAYSGVAFAGLSFHTSGGGREYLTAPLNSPLLAGVIYEVSYYVSRAESHGLGTSNFHAVFTAGQIISPANNTSPLAGYTPVDLNPSGTVITNDTGWVKVTGYYTATGGENWVTIGNFYNTIQSTLVQVTSASSHCYYFVEDVAVLPAAFYITSTPEICEGDTATLQAFNSSNYWWSTSNNPNDTIDTGAVVFVFPSVTTLYIGHSDDGTDTATVTVNPLPVVNLGPDTALCTGSFTLDAGNPGFIHLWSDSSANQTLTLSQTGNQTVWVQVTDPVTGCSATDTIQISLMAMPQPDLGPDTLHCGDSLVLHAATSAMQYTWSTGDTTASIHVKNSGAYWVVTANAGCVDSDTVVVTLHPVPAVHLGNDTVLCESSLMLDAANTGSSFLWSDGSTAQTKLVDSTGIYWVMVDNGNCLASDTIQVTVASFPVVDLGPDTILCEENYVINAGNFAGYQWSTGHTSPSINTDTSGWFSVIVYDGYCFGADSVKVTINKYPVVSLPEDTLVCPGDTLILNAFVPGAAIYEWSDGTIQPQISVTEAGTWDITVIQNGCSVTKSVEVVGAQPPDLDAGYSLCNGTVELVSGVPGDVLWSTGATTPTLKVNNPGVITLQVTYGHCVMYDSTEVTGNPGESLYLPNAFRPNSDGLNDYFPGPLPDLELYSLNIFNRDGEMIFGTDDPTLKWDGTYKGSDCQIGVYVYTVSWKSSCDFEQRSKNGVVTLVR